jgi:hypothetical protein
MPKHKSKNCQLSDIRKFENKLKQGPRFKGRADFLKRCDQFLDGCTDYNEYTDEARNEFYQELLNKYKKLSRTC